LEELNALQIILPGEPKVPLTKAQRDVLFLKLHDNRKVTFESLRKTLKLDPAARFNKESDNRKDITDRFQRHLIDDHGCDVLVMGPRAAGTGFTLTAANDVIHRSQSIHALDRGHSIVSCTG
jgi:hypothetical protein